MEKPEDFGTQFAALLLIMMCFLERAIVLHLASQTSTALPGVQYLTATCGQLQVWTDTKASSKLALYFGLINHLFSTQATDHQDVDRL